MKRDAGVTEVIGAIILIAITVVGAGIVMSLIMTPPDRAMPVLDYYGCNPTGETKCIVHQGGATLYAGQYYLRGLDKNNQDRNAEWNIPGCDGQGCQANFTLENRICTDTPGVEHIQLIIIDETGHSLHGTVLAIGRCIGESAPCAGPDPNDPRASVVGINWNQATCRYECDDRLPPNEGTCVRPESCDPHPCSGVVVPCDPNVDPDCDCPDEKKVEKYHGTPVQNEVVLNPPNAPTHRCEWVCKAGTDLQGREPKTWMEQYTCSNHGSSEKPTGLTFSVCYIRGQEPPKSVIQISNIKNLNTEYNLQLVFDDGTTSNHGALQERRVSGIGTLNKKPIAGVNVLKNNQLVHIPGTSPMTLDPNQWCPCPQGYIYPGQNDDPQKSDIGEACIPNCPDGTVQQSNGSCACVKPDGTIDPNAELTNGTCGCKEGYKYNKDGVCTPIVQITACWHNPGEPPRSPPDPAKPDKHVVMVTGGEPDVTYQIGFDEGGTPSSDFSHVGETKSQEYVFTKPVTSVRLFLDGELFSNVVSLSDNSAYCPGSCPPEQILLPNGDCDCDPDQNYEGVSGNMASSGFQNTVKLLNDERKFGDCGCMPEYFENPPCSIGILTPVACWAHEDKHKVRVISIPDAPIGASYIVKANVNRPGTQPPYKHPAETIGKILEYLDEVTSITLYVDRSDKEDPVKETSEIDFCIPDCPQGDPSCVPVTCTSGDKNCPVECSAPYLTWNGPPKCDCPAGYERVPKTIICNPKHPEITISCTEPTNPTRIQIDWSNADIGAVYDVELIGTNQNGNEGVKIRNPQGSPVTISEGVQEQPQTFTANDPWMKITEVEIFLKVLCCTIE